MSLSLHLISLINLTLIDHRVVTIIVLLYFRLVFTFKLVLFLRLRNKIVIPLYVYIHHELNE